MTHSAHKIVVIGCGSIGERHIRTFLATGRAQVIGCDERPEVREMIATRYGVSVVENWEQALQETNVSGTVIATPASHHIEMALHALTVGKAVLIEKPLAVSLEGIEQLLRARDRAQCFAAVAYVRHCLPPLREARTFIQSGELGAVRHAAVTTGENFPTARPAFRETYYREHAQGGGAIQDALTHLANAVEWILGPTTRVYCDASHQVLEGVGVEDTVNVAARNGDILVSYALNQFQAPVEMRLDFHAERGSVRLELPTRWGIHRLGESDCSWKPLCPLDRDGLFTAQANEFLDGCEGRLTSLCTLEEGIDTLRFNLAAMQSWHEQVPVELSTLRRGASPVTDLAFKPTV